MCAIIGVYNHINSMDLALLGGEALQHRGDEGVGIAYTDGEWLKLRHGRGLVSDFLKALTEEVARNYQISPTEVTRPQIFSLHNTIESAILQTRYSTTYSQQYDRTKIQPFEREFSFTNDEGNLESVRVAVAHNGNITNYGELKRNFPGKVETNIDSEIFLRLMEEPIGNVNLEDRIKFAVSKVEGTFSLLFLTKDKLIAVRDNYGNRPFVYGTIDNATIFASETCALDSLGAKYVGDVKPGEMIVVSKDGMTKEMILPDVPKKKCVFEDIYLKKPSSQASNNEGNVFLNDSKILFKQLKDFAKGSTKNEMYTDALRSIYDKLHTKDTSNKLDLVYVNEIRIMLGQALAIEDALRGTGMGADIVVPVLDSGTFPALGYSYQNNIEYLPAILRSHYVSRVFIANEELKETDKIAESEKKMRKVMKKLQGQPNLLKDQSIILVDDNIVRSDTAAALATIMYLCDARELHFRSASPKYMHPCYYGIDTPTEGELIANRMGGNIDLIKDEINKKSRLFLKEIYGVTANRDPITSLFYLSLEGLKKVVGSEGYCLHCFDGNPITVPKQ